jgi:DNA mismatch repair protein MutS
MKGEAGVEGPSILERAGARLRPAPEVAQAYRDLNLDQLVNALAPPGGGNPVARSVFARGPLPDAQAVTYRQAVFRALEQPPWDDAARAFVAAMAGVRADLATGRSLHYPRQQDWWRLEAVLAYCAAVESFVAAVGDATESSAALAAVLAYAQGYARAAAFTALAREARSVAEELAAVRYCVRVRGAQVTVMPYRGEADASAAVVSTFAPFQQPGARDYRAKRTASAQMNQVECQILDCVALLFPGPFGRLEALRGEDGQGVAFVDPVLERFERELGFYLGYLAYLAPVRAAGLPTCYPEICEPDQPSACRAAYDLVLAHHLAGARAPVVTSEWQAAGGERGFVVTGPNHGGKTTYARAVGQLHVLAALGCPVPGAEARLPVVDRVLTHFEREEPDLGRSKFEDELLRLRDLLAQATPSSLVLVNEMLASTSLADATAIGERVLDRLEATGARYLWVTFVEALARSPRVVSLAAAVGDDLSTTFEVRRGPPAGAAHALALARRHGLERDSVGPRLRA